MWESATILSNSRPAPSFAVHRCDRQRHDAEQQEQESNVCPSFDGKSEEDANSSPLESTIRGEQEGHHDTKVDPSPESCINGSEDANKSENTATGGEQIDVENRDGLIPSPPIFEGNVANATPGDPQEGGTGAGTAQHLACLLDSPLALAILIVLGVNLEARHTAFRRLSIHEAACADSPKCLGLLMEVGVHYSKILFGSEEGGAARASNSVAAARSSSTSMSAQGSGGITPPSPSSPLRSASASFAKELEERNSSGSNKCGKKNLNPFFGWRSSLKQKGNFDLPNKSSSINDCEKNHEATSELTPFATTLKILSQAIKRVKAGGVTEADAARYILDNVNISNRSMLILALQCPHLTPSMKEPEELSSSPSSFVSPMPGLSITGLPQLFLPHHHTPHHILTRSLNRDTQHSYLKRNVDGHGNTPLHWAAFKNSLRAMDVLLSYASDDSAAVDVNSRAQPSGWTPLHDAAYSDAAEAVTRLISAGAYVDARSHSGATPLCFAAQEDAPNATRMLLRAGADPGMRCLGTTPGMSNVRANNADTMSQFQSRFSGYTPLHYCAHYNASKAARVLLYESSQGSTRNVFHNGDLLEISDLNDKPPIHVAVARGSSLVLRELLHGGARVETPSYHPHARPRSNSCRGYQSSLGGVTAMAASNNRNMMASVPMAIPPRDDSSSPPPAQVITPVSSPVLRAMIPSQPITSSKPWNCLSQKSIDSCRQLMEQVEMNWTPERHALFAPSDRAAVIAVLKVGKRLEQVGRGIFSDLWPHVLSFCGRGWFEHIEDDDVDEKQDVIQDDGEQKVAAIPDSSNGNEEHHEGGIEEAISMQFSLDSPSNESSGEDGVTQFQLDETSPGMSAIL